MCKIDNGGGGGYGEDIFQKIDYVICELPLIGLQPTKTRGELDSSTVFDSRCQFFTAEWCISPLTARSSEALLDARRDKVTHRATTTVFETNILRVSPVNAKDCRYRESMIVITVDESNSAHDFRLGKL